MASHTDIIEQNPAGCCTRERKPIIALLLSICPGLGQHYAGHMKRGIIFYISLIIVSWLAAIAFMSVKSKFSIVFLCIPFVGVGLIAIDAYLLARQQPKAYRLQWYNRRWLCAGIFLTLLFTVNPLMDQIIGKHVVRAFMMNSASMAPAILEHDIILVNKLRFPKRGDIALIKFGEHDSGSKLSQLADDQLIKRIIAGPGDKLEIRNGEVWLNGQKIDEPYANHEGILHFSNAQASNFGPKTLPEGYYFVMGDNRNESLDSRILGLIHANQIEGTVTKIFWSWNFDEGGIRWDRTAMSLE